MKTRIENNVATLEPRHRSTSVMALARTTIPLHPERPVEEDETAWPYMAMMIIGGIALLFTLLASCTIVILMAAGHH